jgi:hypothetical protein
MYCYSSHVNVEMNKLWNYWFFGKAIRGISSSIPMMIYQRRIASHVDLELSVLNSLIKTAVDADMIQNQRQVGVEDSAVIDAKAVPEPTRQERW